MKTSTPVAKSRPKSKSRSKSKSPSRQELQARCQKVQSEWTAAERSRRQVSTSSRGKKYRIDPPESLSGLDPVFLAHLNFARLLAGLL